MAKLKDIEKYVIKSKKIKFPQAPNPIPSNKLC